MLICSDHRNKTIESNPASLLSKSTQNLSNCIREEVKEWDDETETPRCTLTAEPESEADLNIGLKLSSSHKNLKEKSISNDSIDQMILSSSDSEIDFFKDEKIEDEQIQYKDRDLEDVIKCASNLTRGRRDEFFQSLNSIHLPENYPIQNETMQVPEKECFDNDKSLFKKMKLKKQKQIPKKKHSRSPVKQNLRTPQKNIKKKQSFKDILKTKKKSENVIQIDLRPKSKKREAQVNFTDKIKQWNKISRIGAGIKYNL